MRPVRYRFGSSFAVQNGEGARPVDTGAVTQVDGEEALVLDFPVNETDLDGGEETAWLYWERDESGTHGYAGVDSVRAYGTPRSSRDLLELLRQLLRDHVDV
ncbi:hypothetical protein [Haloarcula rubra]|uniref:hypothetical protein n=1 Tax=Haloarcula rubra TaxID=2487747 RepID=UPI001F403ABD|nr:hypothetical protein [Halomicroarcula rubra]